MIFSSFFFPFLSILLSYTRFKTRPSVIISFFYDKTMEKITAEVHRKKVNEAATKNRSSIENNCSSARNRKKCSHPSDYQSREHGFVTNKKSTLLFHPNNHEIAVVSRSFKAQKFNDGIIIEMSFVEGSTKRQE